jgi:hypothetical protein
MKHKRLIVLCSLILALGMSLSVPATGAGEYCSFGYKGAVTNYTDDGTCYWQCCSSKVGSASGVTISQCRQLCVANCGGACDALY